LTAMRKSSVATYRSVPLNFILLITQLHFESKTGYRLRVGISIPCGVHLHRGWPFATVTATLIRLVHVVWVWALTLVSVWPVVAYELCVGERQSYPAVV
jgi:hypothetical protein